MKRTLLFAVALATATMLGNFVTADEPVRSDSQFRTTEYSPSDAQIVQVRDRGRSYRGRYYGNRGYYYSSPYRNGYRSYNYGYRSYPNYYYGNRYYGNRYYNYGYRGNVRVGPVDVWW